MKIGGKYNWKGQEERLAYLGRNWSGNGYWHQFEKIDAPGTVWCEVQDGDLRMFEETTEVVMPLLSERERWNLEIEEKKTAKRARKAMP